MNNKRVVVVVVNKDDGVLDPSETFLHAHMDGLPCTVIPMAGIPNRWRLLNTHEQYVPSRSLLPLGLRWLARKTGIASISSQDSTSFARFLRERCVSAVLAEYGSTAVKVMEACRYSGVPLIAHFHGYDAYRRDMLKVHTTSYSRLFKVASAVIAVSQHMREQLIQLGANPESTVHNSCGAAIPAETKAFPSQSERRFLAVGRLVEKKAPFLTVMAFAKVATEYSDARLDVVGDGHLRQSTEQLARSLGVADRVHFHGALTHKQVFAFMEQARCFVQHSVATPDGDHEGTPVSVLEAMGMGLPVVATRHGGILDVVEDGRTGSLVDEYDVNGMAQALLRYAADADLAQQVGSEGKKSVLANWTADKSIGRLWRTIESVIEKKQVADE